MFSCFINRLLLKIIIEYENSTFVKMKRVDDILEKNYSPNIIFFVI